MVVNQEEQILTRMLSYLRQERGRKPQPIGLDSIRHSRVLDQMLVVKAKVEMSQVLREA